VHPITELPERFTWLDSLYVGESNPVKVRIEAARIHNKFVLIKLAGFDDRDAADSLRGELLQIPEEEGLPLAEGEYYLYQLLGLSVFTEQGEQLGSVVDVIETNANNVFVLDGAAGEVLLPDIEEVILDIDFDNDRMLVRLMPGLLPD
jgi:16S rRNA processing protein RimM